MVESKSLGGRWFLILFVAGLAVFAFLYKRSAEKPWGMAFGQDLKGGRSLRFSLDVEQARRENRIDARESAATIVDQTLDVLQTRLNKFGMQEINLVRLGEDKFEISIPIEVDPDSIKKVVSALGELKFRIEVLPEYSEFKGEHGATRTRNRVWEGAAGKGADGTDVSFSDDRSGFEAYKKQEVERWKTAREKVLQYVPLDRRYRVVPRERRGVDEDDSNLVPPSAVEEFAVLEWPVEHSVEDLGGEILTNVRAGPDNEGGPGVHYNVKLDYQNAFGNWTGRNVGLPMAIVLNEEFHNAPIINSELRDSVVITLGRGGGGTRQQEQNAQRRLEQEQKQLVAILQSGSLKIRPTVEGTTVVGATLAGEAVARGLLSTAIAFLLVLIYMGIYYFRAGMIANVALLMNLVLLVGAMAFLDATLTLPGIAGIVLTLGMAVDANILVYERIREEQARGRSVHKAVSEGFDRAFTTIVDSNVTTFFTALFLLWFGEGAIKGFAVTLILGLVASMFTAVYVTRTIFEQWIKRGGVDRIAMLGTGKPPTIRWMHLRRIFIPSSIVLMLVGLLIFAVSPRSTVYDIDFTGGMKLSAHFNRVTTIEDVKKALDGGVKSVHVLKDPARGEGTTGYMDVDVGPYTAEVVTVGSDGDKLEIRAPLATGDAKAASLREREQIDALVAYLQQTMGDRLVPPWVRAHPAPYKSLGDADPMKAFDGRLKLQIAIEDPGDALTAARLRDALTRRMPYFDYQVEGRRRVAMPVETIDRTVEVKDVEAATPGAKSLLKTYDIWWKADRKGTANDHLENDPDRLLADLREFLSGGKFKDSLKLGGASKNAVEKVALADPFPSSDLIGAGVAQRLRNGAMLALLLSFVAIVIYVAFRFRSYAMGFSAVLCLVHDVLIALGFVCLVDHLGIVDAKISLGLVAAFLTIVGYSVNDTVVTFDRIRELRGKAPKITVRMIEDAVNQTFSRTLRTTSTVLLTVLVLFALNLGQRSMLEGLSFTLLVGVTSGAYSTIGVASPLLLFLPWFWAKARPYHPRAWVVSWVTRKNGLAALGGIAAVATATAWLLAGSDLDTAHRLFRAIFYGVIVAPILVTVGAWVVWAAAFSVACFLASSIMLIPWSFHEDPEGAVDEAHRELGLAGGGAISEVDAGAAPPADREPPRSAGYKAKGS